MLSDLRLQNFRSYGDDSFEFSPGVNIIVGPNASGKTNLLEAALVLARGNSYRAKDAEMVSFDKPWARLDAHVDGSVVRTLKITTEPNVSKTYELDGKVFKRLSLERTLPAVLFEPNHLQLLHGGPENRREYLDDLLEQTIPGYGSLRRQYRRTLAQRNALLKSAASSIESQIFPWNVRLGELAGSIVRARSELANSIGKQIEPLYKELSHTKVKVALAYLPKFSPEQYESQLLKKLEADLHLDIARGFTASGPHREDFEITMAGRPAPISASRGETRTLVLSLKIIELKTIESSRGARPLLLLDDVFSELDGARRHALTDHLKSYQAFITTTDADVVLQHFANQSNIIPLAIKK